MCTLLRDQCWCSPDECRNVVTIPRGYAEIAEWLGVSRVRTVYDWPRDPLCCVYLRNERSGIGMTKWDAPRQFRVLLDDLPTEILGAGNLENFKEYLNANTFVLGLGHFSASGDANFSMGVTHFSVSGDANFRVKALNSGLNSLNSGINSNPNRAAPKKSDAEQESHENRAGEALNFLNWDWNILETLGVNPATQKEILHSGVEPWVFVSWLLYGQMKPDVSRPPAPGGEAHARTAGRSERKV